MYFLPSIPPSGKNPVSALLFKNNMSGSKKGWQSQPASKETSLEEEEKLYCAACGTWITSGPWRISVQGDHEHTFFNPAGQIFRVGCFKEAPGARAVGLASTEFTWFKRHSWQTAFCGACGEHLGWRFAGDLFFFCLILKKLTPNPQASR